MFLVFEWGGKEKEEKEEEEEKDKVEDKVEDKFKTHSRQIQGKFKATTRLEHRKVDEHGEQRRKQSVLLACY